MSTARFVFVFDGEAVREGSIDIRDFAPAALAVGKLIEEANRVLNDGRSEATVRLKADFNTGSFESIVEVGLSLYEQTKTILLGSEVKEAQDVLEALGFWGGLAGTSLLGLLKLLKGRRPRSATVLENGRVSLEMPNGETVETDRAIADLYNDIKVLQATREIVRPLERDGIDEIRFESTEDRKEGTKIERDDVPSIVEPVEQLEIAEPIHEASSERILRVVSPSFSGDYVWRLTEGGNKISAAMKDANFLKRVEDGEIAFSSGSLLCAEVMTVTSQTPTGKVSARHEITHVLRVIPPPNQTLLQFDAQADSSSANDQT